MLIFFCFLLNCCILSYKADRAAVGDNNSALYLQHMLRKIILKSLYFWGSCNLHIVSEYMPLIMKELLWRHLSDYTFLSMGLGSSSEYTVPAPHSKALLSPGICHRDARCRGKLGCQEVQTSVDEDALTVTYAVLEVMLKHQVEQKKNMRFLLIFWTGSMLDLTCSLRARHLQYKKKNEGEPHVIEM